MPRRVPRRRINSDSLAAPSPVITIAGIVPRPNAIMIIAPLAGSALVEAISKTL